MTLTSQDVRLLSTRKQKSLRAMITLFLSDALRMGLNSQAEVIQALETEELQRLNLSYMPQAQIQAQSYYTELRTSVISSPYTPALLPLTSSRPLMDGLFGGYGKLKKTLEFLPAIEFSPRYVLEQVNDISTDTMFSTFRETIKHADANDSASRGVRSITAAGACAWCLYLATEVTVGDRGFHNKCRCIASPSFNGLARAEPTPEQAAFQEAFNNLPPEGWKKRLSAMRELEGLH